MEVFYLLIFIFVGIPMLIASFIACFLCAEAARNKGRSHGGWFCLAFFITPFYASIILIALGDTEQRRREKKEEILFDFKQAMRKIIADNESRRYSNQQSTDENSHKRFQPAAKIIDDMYKH
jgi:hypothetical protein